MGRHKGAKPRTEEEELEHRWRRLHETGKLSLSPGSAHPPWLSAGDLASAFISEIPGTMYSIGLKKTQALDLLELVVSAIERNPTSIDRFTVEWLARNVRAGSFDPKVVERVVERLAAVFPDARLDGDDQGSR